MPALQTDLLTDWRPRLIAIATAGGNGDGAHDLNHLHRVWHAARTLLAEHPAADALVVLAACYLHDLVNLPKNHPERAQASRLAARLACERLAQAAFPADRLAGVAHAIEAHSFSAAIAPTTIEAMIVQDAADFDFARSFRQSRGECAGQGEQQREDECFHAGDSSSPVRGPGEAPGCG